MLINALEAIGVVDLVVASVLVILLAVICLLVIKQAKHIALLMILLGVSITCYLFELTITSLVFLGLFFVYLLFIVLTNADFINKSIDKLKKSKNLQSIQKDGRKDFLDELETAVLSLSSSKTGALMVIEKQDNLDQYIEKGKPVKAPVSSEVINTIFYPGTALHDGAIIIRGNIIEAASVYFIPTTKPMKGHFGARHRAGLGFSEMVDSIVIIVSEETGRISFAIDGELIPCARDTFRNRLSEYLDK